MSSETREKILQTALDLFVHQGYTATSMRQVAEQAGIGKATIYHHFADKQAIILALLHTSLSKMQRTLEVTRAEQEPRRRFQVAAESSLNFLLDSADILQIARREVPDGREQFQASFLTFQQTYMNLLVEAIQQGIQQGLFRPLDPLGAARVFMTMLQGNFAMAYLTGERPPSSHAAAAALLDVFFRGIQAQEPV